MTEITACKWSLITSGMTVLALAALTIARISM